MSTKSNVQQDETAFFQSYEQQRIMEVEKFLSLIRLCYALFSTALLFLVAGGVWPSYWALLMFSASFLAYSIIRYLKPLQFIEIKYPPVIFYLPDFVFIGLMTYFAGGVRSFFHIAHALTICGGVILFGFRGGITSFAFSVLIIVIMAYAGITPVPFRIIFHLISGIGTFAFILWMVAVIVKKEWELRKKIFISSITDNLTGLYNGSYYRERIFEEIKRCQREGGGFAVVFLDLNDFKRINDKYGHLAGDEALKHAAKVLKENTRGSEVLARYGGDEFVLLMPDVDREKGEKAAWRICRELYSKPFIWNSEQIKIGISAGTAVFPEDGKTLDQLLSAADQRMYQQKK
ncbi:MAG: hypothetical protein CVU88_03295 [Firmicutes bacterium HGW-Firmicutes-13]|nr:MAG: hypothetical protein CVU88_03295 [Firmicutes bacterium HGW-Firmicutes-13]